MSKSQVVVFETCSIDLRRTLNIAALGASVALAVAPHRIPKTLAIAAALILAIAIAVSDDFR